MIAASASTAIQVRSEEEKTFLINKNPKMKIAELELAPIAGEREIQIQTKPKAYPVFAGTHPSVASDGLGYVVMGFEDESPNVWFTASDDGGQNWATEAYGWSIDPEPELPDLDSCGDGRFIGGMVPNYLATDGSELYKVEITDPMDFTPDAGGYACPFWTWNDVGDGYDNFRAVAVAGYTAADPNENTWAFGGHAIVGDHGGESGEETNLFSYQSNEEGSAWIYRWTGLNGATDCAHDIDPTNLYSYAAWNYDNEGDLDLYISVMDFGTWEPYGSSQIHTDVTDLGIEATGDDAYIDISANNDNVILVSQRAGDIIAYYSTDGMSNVNEATIETSAVNPRIVHTGDLKAICTFIIGEQVWYSTTEDGGETWSTPELLDEPENDYVPEEYKASDISGFGACWMNEDDGYSYFGAISSGDPPVAPTISGPGSGSPGTTYTFTITATDPDGDDVYYYVDWGDDTNSGWIGPFASGTGGTATHSWSEEGDFVITAKAKDENGLIGPEATKSISMPRSRSMLNFLENFPILYQFLKNFFGI